MGQDKKRTKTDNKLWIKNEIQGQKRGLSLGFIDFMDHIVFNTSANITVFSSLFYYYS